MRFKFYDKFALVTILVFIGINFLDLLTTIYALEIVGNCYEFNPIARYFFDNYGYGVGFLFNISWICLIVPTTLLIGKLSYTKIEKKKYTKKTRRTHAGLLCLTMLLLESFVIANNLNEVWGIL